jgi:iron complex outermembrane receptor protein
VFIRFPHSCKSRSAVWLVGGLVLLGRDVSAQQTPESAADNLEGSGDSPGAWDLLLREDWTDGQAPAALDTNQEQEESESTDADVPLQEGSGQNPVPAAAANDNPVDWVGDTDTAPSAVDDPVQGGLDLGRERVTGALRRDERPASVHRIELGQLRAVPRRNAAETMMMAPGVLVTNAGGEGHAVTTFLRGFSGGEGENLETLVDGMPINEVSNSHSHGYADTHFVVPEGLHAVSVRNGPFEPDQGDFAFAGTSEFEPGVDSDRRGTSISVRLGSFAERRTVFLVAPESQEQGTFAVAELHRSEGYGQNRASERATVMARYARGFDEETSAAAWSLAAYGHAARFDQPGVVREDDVETGTIGHFGTYDPNQGGESTRISLVGRLRLGASAQRFLQTNWLTFRNFRLRENFTGTNTENRYEAITAGSRGEFSQRFFQWSRAHRIRTGYSIRYDSARTQQLSLRPRTAIPSSRVFDADIRQMNLSAYTGLELQLLPGLSLRPSVRLDAFSFGVTDLNMPTEDRDGAREPDQTLQSLGYAWNPRVASSYELPANFRLDAAWGTATRSSDAIALSDGETAPFARSQQMEAGLSWLANSDSAWNFATGLTWVYASVDKELVFVPEEARNDIVGSSRRNAVLSQSRLQVGRWFDANVSFAWTQATLVETGDLLPYVPQFLARADMVFTGGYNWLPESWGASFFVGTGFTGMPGRPLPLDETGNAFSLLDASAGANTRWVSLAFEARNVLNRKYGQEEYFYASTLGREGAVAPRSPQRHFVAGEPFSAFLTCTVHLDALFSRSSDSTSQELAP